jgi:hypothetical protein
MTRLWFSIYNREDYNGPEPAFFNPERYEFLKTIELNYEIINQELLDYLNEYQLTSYFNESMVASKNSWKTISLKTWNVNLYENHKYFPKTLRIIKSIPSIVSASFNLLEPKGHILPHCGDTNGIFRCHLGLSIPKKIPECGFRVKEEWRSWEEGKLLVFVDANNHEAVNMSDSNRFIFLFDVVREEFFDHKKMICATVITSLFLQKRVQKVPFLTKSPLWMQILIVKLLLPFTYIAIPSRNFIHKILNG